MASQIVIVAGLSGAGKTSLLSAVHGGYRVITIGDMMEKDAVRKGLVRNRDQLKSLPHGQYDALRRRAYAQFSKASGRLVLDTHLTIESGARMEPALPFSFMKGLSGIRSLVYINAESKDILARRRKDERFRSRDLPRRASLDMQRTIDLSILAYLSTSLDVPLYVVDNAQGRMRSASAQLGKVISESFGE